MKPKLRHPETGDRERIRAALEAALYLSLAPEGSSESTVSYLCDDPLYTVELIVQGIVDSVVIDEAYLLVYSVAKPWYSKNQWLLSEDLVLRIGKGSSFRAVTETLDFLAEDNECVAIITGGALARNTRAITRLYQQSGYALEKGSPKFTKRRT